MSGSQYRYSMERHTRADDMYACAGLAVSTTKRAILHTTPVVNNYFVQDDRSIPVPLFFTPNASMEDLVLSQSQHTPSIRGKRGRAQTTSTHGGAAISTQTQNDRCIGHTSAHGVVNPYAREHQGPVQPISPQEEERMFLDKSVEYYRRQKLSRKEPLTLTEEEGGNSVVGKNNALWRSELRRIQEQYEHLSKVVEETRAELQRSREAGDCAKENDQRILTELRVEVGQLKKHVELLEGRNSSLEQSVGVLKGVQSLVDTFRGEVASLRQEIHQKSTVIAVLEKSVEEVRSRLPAPSAHYEATYTASAAPPTRVTAPSLAGFTPTTPAVLSEPTKPTAGPFSFGAASASAKTESDAGLEHNSKPEAQVSSSTASLPTTSFLVPFTSTTGGAPPPTSSFSFANSFTENSAKPNRFIASSPNVSSAPSFEQTTTMGASSLFGGSAVPPLSGAAPTSNALSLPSATSIAGASASAAAVGGSVGPSGTTAPPVPNSNSSANTNSFFVAASTAMSMPAATLSTESLPIAQGGFTTAPLAPPSKDLGLLGPNLRKKTRQRY